MSDPWGALANLGESDSSEATLDRVLPGMPQENRPGNERIRPTADKEVVPSPYPAHGTNMTRGGQPVWPATFLARDI
jgi:hypothetical protein